LSCRTAVRRSLLDVLEFRSQCQNFCLTGEPAGMFGVQGDTSKVVPGPQPHQVVPSELLAGQAVSRFIVHPPSPRQILVGDPFLTEVPIRLAARQHIPDQFQELPCDCHDRMVAVHPFLQGLEFHLQQGVRLDYHLRRFHQCPPQLTTPFLRHAF
jgi:hypothetical protein